MVAARIIRDMKFNFKLNNYVRDDPGFAKLPSVLLDRLHIPRRSSTLPVFQEAPTFRNGKECIVSAPSSWRSGYSQLQEEEDDDTELCDSTTVHIAMTLDAAYLRGLVVGILSILQHAACPENVVFHFMVSERQRDLKATLQATFPYLRFILYHFDSGESFTSTPI